MPRLWDDSLYAGSAESYLVGRLPYPERLAAILLSRIGVTDGRLLDLGCGPGTLTVVLAPRFAEVVAVDADVDMVQVGEREAMRRGIDNVRWIHGCAEDLDLAHSAFDVVTLAQSFHWMDRPVVAANIRRWLRPDGWLVHVGANTHEGERGVAGLPHPTPPGKEVTALVRRYLGPQRRAGQSTVPDNATPDREGDVYRAAGFVGPEDIEVPGGDLHVRTVEQVVAVVLSLSSSAPHLFGDRLEEFLTELRALLMARSDHGLFSEQQRPITLSLWRNP